MVEIEIHDPKPNAFGSPQTGAVHQTDHQRGVAVQMGEQRLNFRRVHTVGRRRG